MKILHMSDLHLGRRFYNLSFLSLQKTLLQDILHCVDTHEIAVVLLSGDIYDKPVPPAEAVALFDWFLTQLAERDLSVCLISGNHDSPERLQFGSGLLQKNHIYIAGAFQGKLHTVTLSDEYGDLQIAMLPYVKPVQLAAYYPEQSFSNLTEGIQYVLQQTPPDPNSRSILLYHGFVLHNGAMPDESESEIQLGGMQLVNDDIFQTYDYVALGHIHKPQWVQKDRIRYSGSLMKYSFSECLQQKSVTILDMQEKGNCTITTVPLMAQQDMRILHGPCKELLEYAVTSEDFIRAELTDLELIPNAMEKLRLVYPNVLELAYVTREQNRHPAAATEAAHVPEQSLKELLLEFYQNVYHYDLSERPEQLVLLEKLLEEEELA
ncbi:MAG: exonuclease SbcCD subunit D [Oscillospiraceae bacterium]|nr:exonuclease SbcCD subunit D [Oscillospiraceae bacterium]